VIASINISILFTELPYLERFAAAAAAGFQAVESWWPRGEDLNHVRDAARDAGVELAVLNFDAGDMPGGDRGLLSDLERDAAFRDNVPLALELAAALGCRRLNALLGTERPGQDRGEQLRLAERNVRDAAREAAGQGATILIEPVNRIENGPYLIDRTDDAVTFIEAVGESNVALQYDCYHAQRTEGNLVATLRRHARRLGHVQVADSPDRHEPGTGEIAYPFVLRSLAATGYDGFLGLEYKAAGATRDALAWLPREQRRGPLDIDRLFDFRAEVAR
jgi:hydroxypyruvate isomerase